MSSCEEFASSTSVFEVSLQVHLDRPYMINFVVKQIPQLFTNSSLVGHRKQKRTLFKADDIDQVVYCSRAHGFAGPLGRCKDRVRMRSSTLSTSYATKNRRTVGPSKKTSEQKLQEVAPNAQVATGITAAITGTWVCDEVLGGDWKHYPEMSHTP
jgi:hypothetical protein